jgi:3-methyladenine DNA glycosylase AlkD
VSRRKTGAGTANRTLIAAVRRELQAHADAVKAPQMQAYMKSSMPYYVDLIAGKRIGLLLKNHPREMKPLLRAWSRCGDLWKRRTAILAQLGFKTATDLGLLYDCIEPNIEDREFFIRKAIGWALRQHAWTDPIEVRRYVKANRERLSGFSTREALKNVGP